MVGIITLTFEEDGKFGKDTKSYFKDIDKAKKCYMEAQLGIRKCAGPPDMEEMMMDKYRSREFEENLNIGLNNMEKSVMACSSDTINISNNITKNFTLIDERIRVGLLYSVDENKINDKKNKFNDLKNQFINNCECNTKKQST